MSERKRGFHEESESSQKGSAKKAARRAPGEPSVDPSLSLLQPGRVPDDRSDTEQLQSQAAAGGRQQEEQAVAPQGHGRSVDWRTQDLISAIDFRGMSSLNRQAGGIDGVSRGRAQVPRSQGDETLASKDAMGITGPSSEMSKLKRGFDDGAGSSQQGSAKKATRAPGDPSVDTSLSLVQPGGVVDDRSNTEQLQSQAAVGRAQEELTVATKERGRGLERRTQDLISATDLRSTSSVNRQAGGVDSAGGWRAPMPQSQGNVTLAPIRAAMGMNWPWIYPDQCRNATGIGVPIPGIGALPPPRPLISATNLRSTSPVNHEAGGIDSAGRGRAQVPQSQGDETLAGKDAMGITGPWSCPGGATRMAASIPVIGAAVLLPATENKDHGLGPETGRPNRAILGDEASNLTVTVPGWPSAPPLFKGSLVMLLFDQLQEPCLSKYYAMADKAEGLAPPNKIHSVYVKLRKGLYVDYLANHLNGLASRAHNILVPADALKPGLRTTLKQDGSNRGVIKAALCQLFEPLRPLKPSCDLCKAPADSVSSCYGIKFCSLCLGEGCLKKHFEPLTRSSCNGKGAIGPLEGARGIVEMLSNLDEGLVCTWQMVVTFVEEMQYRQRQVDTFLFRTMTSVGTIGNRTESLMKCTHVFHMRQNGTLKRICKFSRHLPFLR